MDILSVAGIKTENPVHSSKTLLQSQNSALFILNLLLVSQEVDQTDLCPPISSSRVAGIRGTINHWTHLLGCYCFPLHWIAPQCIYVGDMSKLSSPNLCSLASFQENWLSDLLLSYHNFRVMGTIFLSFPKGLDIAVAFGITSTFLESVIFDNGNCIVVAFS